MLLPIRTDRPLRSTPVVNVCLIVLCVAGFALQEGFPQIKAALTLRPHEPRLVQFIGSAFLHGGELHLVGNMLFLYIFGNSVNDKLGNLTYLGLYVGGAFAAGLLHVLGEDNPAVGASGAIAAVTGAYLVLFPRSRVQVLFFFFIITVVSVPSLWFIGLFFLLDVFRQFDNTLLGGETAVAHLAHIGGTLYGIAVAAVLLATDLVPRDQMDGLALLRRWRLRREHAAAVKAGRASGVWTGAPLDIAPKAMADPKLARVQDLRSAIGDAIARDNLRDAAKLYVQLMRVDAEQVLAMQDQLDVANQLVSDGRHADAAAAYERFLTKYDRHDEHARTQLMLGLLYNRYLQDGERAAHHLRAALPRLDDADERAIGERELASLSPAPSA